MRRCIKRTARDGLFQQIEMNNWNLKTMFCFQSTQQHFPIRKPRELDVKSWFKGESGRPKALRGKSLEKKMNDHFGRGIAFH